MALSGSKTNNFTSGFGLKLNWSAVQNITNNQSTITVQVYLALSNASINVGSRSDGSITIDGLSKTTTYNAVRQSTATTKDFLLSTWSRTVNHSADGTKSFTVSANYPIRATLSGNYFGNVSVSTTGTLDTIPRASQPRLSATTQNLDSAITIYTDRASTDFTHTLTYSFGNQSGTIGTEKGVTTSQAWTLPVGLASAIPNATSGTGTITCITYNGNDLVGTKSVPFVATVPDNATFQPTVSVWDISEATTQPEYITNQGIYVATKSSLRVQSTATPKFGASITSYKTYVDGYLYNGNDITSRIINTVGTVNVEVHATDSRGYTGTNPYAIHLDFKNYYPPRINSFSATRSPDENGKDIKVTFDYTVPSMMEDGIDTGSFSEVFYRPKGGSFVSLYFVDLAGSQYDTRTIANKLDVNTSYEVELRVTDFWTTVTQRVSIGTGFTLINFNTSGKGMAIGKVSESDSFEVAMPSDFREPIKLLGGVNSTYTSNLDTTFTSGLYYYDTGTQGRPTSYGAVQTIVGNGAVHNNYDNWLFQLAFDTYGGVYHRRKINAGEFQPWARLWTSGNSNAMIDSGTNTNGRYIRFSDGTQICWNRVSFQATFFQWYILYAYDHKTKITFPADFIERPMVSVTNSGAAGAMIGLTTADTTGMTQITLVRPNIANTTYRIDYIAIGRWK